MPTNLPPECVEIEQQYRAAKSIPEKIQYLEELLGAIPKHKGTDRLRADYRRRLSKLKDAAQSRKGAGRQESPFQIDREGAGQVAVIGLANVGKSALVAALTNASPEVADFPFTTWAPTPGMMEVEYVQIQLIDTPPLDRDFAEPEFLNLLRRVDLILLVVDLQSYPIQQFEDALAFLARNRIAPGHLAGRDPGQRALRFIPLLVVVNKCDDERLAEDFDVLCELLGEEWTLVPASATTGYNLPGLKRAVLDQLGLIRIFAKPPGKEADLTAPFVMKKGGTVEEFAGKIHQDFLKSLKTARVWGSAAFDGQTVGRDYVLQDGDVVELRT
ncbi:MAG: TGS domain-containing protein [Anaerolineae bacterium]|nr:TGS domain-containing protein [Anaerolineae bacterium]